MVTGETSWLAVQHEEDFLFIAYPQNANLMLSLSSPISN